jgi:hypothetical protein
MDKQKSIEHLISAEAEYLSASGWTPRVSHGKVKWLSPCGTKILFQDNAVREQKEGDHESGWISA